MTNDALAALQTQLIASLEEAYRARRGVPKTLEPQVRAYANALRAAHVPIERVIVELKALLATTVREDAPIFTPRLVGWTVAGYFHGVTSSVRT